MLMGEGASLELRNVVLRNCSAPSWGEGFARYHCEARSIELGLNFSTQLTSNGVPAGCIRYDDGRVVFVEACSGHANCGTNMCTGCSVLESVSGREGRGGAVFVGRNSVLSVVESEILDGYARHAGGGYTWTRGDA